MDLTKEFSIETIERFVRLIQKSNQPQRVAKDVACYQSGVYHCCYKCQKKKKNEMIKKRKPSCKSQNTSKRQEKKFKAICFEKKNATKKKK